MKKQNSLLVVISILLLLVVPLVGTADIDEGVMTAGDTFIYTVDKLDVPWEDLFDIPSSFTKDLVFDLTGSTLAVKVMTVDDDGYYMLNSYIILGKDIEIPFPEDDVSKEITEIFGDKLIIPEGVGLGIGVAIPGSDYLDAYGDDFDNFPGIPFYFDPDEWDTYEDMFSNLEDAMDEMENPLDITITNEGDEFLLKFESEIGEGAGYLPTETTEWSTASYGATEETTVAAGPDVGLYLEIAWHRDGKYAGVFKRMSGEIDLIGEEDTITMRAEISFDEKRHNPLPDEILDEETITLELDKGSFNYDATGFFEENQFDNFLDLLDDIEGELDDTVGEDIYEFGVTDVEGCYYETDISIYDGNDLELSAQDVWWNGFNGFTTSLDRWASGPWEDWQFSPTIGIIPLMAPGITPDWDMWRASTLSISSILETLEDAFTSTAAEDELEAVGVTINEFDITYEMRANKDFKFFFFESDVDIVIDTSDMEGFYLIEDEIYPRADGTLYLKLWLAYTHEGLIAGVGATANVEVDLTDVPIGEDPYTYDTIYDDGSLSFDVEAEIRNTDIKSLPDPTSLPIDMPDETTEPDESEESDTFVNQSDYPSISPGFALIPVLLVLAAIKVIYNRRRD